MADWEAIERSDEFQELIKKRRSFVVPGDDLLPRLVHGASSCSRATRPDFMGESVYEGLTVGYCLALTQFVMVFVLGLWYLRKSDQEFDPLADAVVAAAAEEEGARASRAEDEHGGRRDDPVRRRSTSRRS